MNNQSWVTSHRQSVTVSPPLLCSPGLCHREFLCDHTDSKLFRHTVEKNKGRRQSRPGLTESAQQTQTLLTVRWRSYQALPLGGRGVESSVSAHWRSCLSHSAYRTIVVATYLANSTLTLQWAEVYFWTTEKFHKSLVVMQLFVCNVVIISRGCLNSIIMYWLLS